MSVQVKGSGTIGGLDEGLNITGVVTATSFDGNITGTVGVGTDNPQGVLHIANTNTTVWPFSTSVSANPSYTPYSHELVIDNDVSNVTGSFAGIYFNAGGYATTSSVSRVSTARIAAIDTGDYKADLAFSTRGYGGSDHKENLRITSSGKLLLGITTARTPQNITTQLQIEGTTSHTSSMSMTRNQDNTYGPDFIFNKSRGASVGSDVIVQNNDALGNITWVGNDGTDSDSKAARIQGAVDGTPGSNDMPGRITFWTTPDGSNILAERLRITSDGKIGIGVTNPLYDLQIAGNYGIGKTSSNGSYGYFVPYNGSTGNMEFHLNWPGGSTESMIFNITGNERMRISPQGYVTKPEHPYFNARTTPTAGSPNIHSFGVVMSNNGNHYNNSNGRFTAPVAGFYHFSFGIWCNASGSTSSKHIQLMKYINATGLTEAVAGANHITQYNNLNGSSGCHLEVGDYVYLHQTGITIQPSTPRNFFSGHLVG